MDLNALRLFVTVVELNGFSAAARELGMSKSTVSLQIRSLEADLGVRLLDRTTRSMRLTEAGARLFDQGLQIVVAAGAAQREITQMGAAPIGTLRVSAPSAFGRRFLAPVVHDLLTRYDKLQIEVELSDRWVDLLGEGYDLSIRVGRLPSSELRAQRLGDARFLLVAAPSYLERFEAPEKPADLKAHACLRYSYQNPVDRWLFTDPATGKELRIPVSGRFVGNDGELIAKAAAAGLGIAWLPDFIARDFLEAGTLVGLLKESCTTVSPIHLLLPERRHRAQKETVFIERLVAHLRDSLGPQA